MGCTHYSIIEKEILSYFNNSINIITSFNSIIDNINYTLDENNLISNKKNGEDNYFITDLGQTFKKQAKSILGVNSINIQLINLLK